MKPAVRASLSALAVIALGVALGLGSAVWRIHHTILNGQIRVGPWHSFRDAGGPGRGALERTAVALGALLALRHTEALYFEADTDPEGNPLDGQCTYELAGNDLPARWWSVTVYGSDRYLIPNSEHRWSFTGSSLLHTSDGTWRVVLSPTHHTTNWLPTGTAHRVIVLLRMYNPAGTAVQDPAGVLLPSIVRRGCP